MDVASGIALGLLALTVLLFITLFWAVIYSGLFTRVVVGAGRSPVENITIAYKFGRGPYKNTGEVFTEVVSLAPRQRALGIYYDDPQQVSSEMLRWAVGCILAEGKEIPDADLVKQLLEKEYKLFVFPKVSNSVRTTFPYNTPLSIYIAIYRVYPLLSQYVTENKLCAHPFLEIYDGHTIHFLAPLAKQDEFYVPETTLPEGTAEGREATELQEAAEVRDTDKDESTQQAKDGENIASEADVKLEKDHEAVKTEKITNEEKIVSETDVNPEKDSEAAKKVKEVDKASEEEADVLGQTGMFKAITPVQKKAVQDSGISSSTDSFTSSCPSSPGSSEMSSPTDASTETALTDDSGMSGISQSVAATTDRETSTGTSEASFQTARTEHPAGGPEFSSDSETETSSFEEVKMDDIKQ